MVTQISRLPGGGKHVAQINGSIHQVINEIVGHYTEHAARGGYVGIAKVGAGYVVQLHAADGRIEAFTLYRA